MILTFIISMVEYESPKIIHFTYIKVLRLNNDTILKYIITYRFTTSFTEGILQFINED